LLFVSQLAGFALLLGNKGGAYSAYALPYGVASVLMALNLFPAPRLRVAVPVAALTAMTVAGSIVIIGEARSAEDSVLTTDISRAARALVKPTETVVGEQLYWWLYRDQRFVANSAIWQQRYDRGDTLEQAVHRICPDVILLDGLWLYRYNHLDVGRRYANSAPTDPRELPALRGLLRREYKPVRRLGVGPQQLVFWRHTAGHCPPHGARGAKG
jgi:hypothetical protein